MMKPKDQAFPLLVCRIVSCKCPGATTAHHDTGAPPPGRSYIRTSLVFVTSVLDSLRARQTRQKHASNGIKHSPTREGFYLLTVTGRPGGSAQGRAETVVGTPHSGSRCTRTPCSLTDVCTSISAQSEANSQGSSLSLQPPCSQPRIPTHAPTGPAFLNRPNTPERVYNSLIFDVAPTSPAVRW